MTRRARLVGAGTQIRLPDSTSAHDVDRTAAVDGSPAGPVRTCVGCRRRAQRSALLRVVRVEDGAEPRAVVDPGRSLPGRGAWLHPDLQCLDLAERRRSVPRALRSGPLDTTAVRRYLEGRTGR